MKKLLDAIIAKGRQEDMECLRDIFLSLVRDKKEHDPMWYKGIVYKLHIMAYGGHLTEHEAHKWVDKMENKEGSTGGHWTYEQTESVRQQFAPELDPCDFYAVLNMEYSDYFDERYDDMYYIKRAKDFLNDKDAAPGKALRYYLYIVQ